MSPRQRDTISGGSKEFSVFVLRRLYNKGSGRGEVGVTRRFELKPTITFETKDALDKTVPTGPGRFGSPVVELALRILLALVGKFAIARVAPELAVALVDANMRGQVVANLRALADAVEAYRPPAPAQVSE